MPDNAALENGVSKQGLLNHALLKDDMEARQPNYEPKDNQITLTEWLSSGAHHEDAVIRITSHVNKGADAVATPFRKPFDENIVLPSSPV